MILISGTLTVTIEGSLLALAAVLAQVEPFRTLVEIAAQLGSVFILLTIMLVAVVIFLVIYFLLSQRSIRYLEEIAAALQKVAGGNFDVVIYRKTQDELGDLAENVNVMARQLKQSIEGEREAERAKNELITSVSHDLRTPLTSIIGYLDLIVNDRCRDEVELKHYADIAYVKAQRLKKLIDDLFEYTKLNNQGFKLNLVKVNLGELLEQLAEEFVPILDAADMQYRMKIPPEKIFILADGDMLARVYENLISNAVRYGRQGKFVDIELLKEGGEAVARVINYGEPIPENELSQIFDRFYRVEKSRSENTGGTGLGLAIAKNIVELHKGRVQAYNQAERTVFETRFPVYG